MRILITGGAGWIARELIKDLGKDHELRLLDRVDPNEATLFAPGSSERVRSPLVTPWPYIRGEINDLDTMRRATENIDGIIHLAAIPTGFPEQGKAIMDANVTGTYVVLDAARLSGVKRVIVASSINAFGTIYWRLSGKPPVYETMPLDETFKVVPEDPYSLSKFFNEETCAAFHRAYGITTAAMRFAGVWTDDLYDRHKKTIQPTTCWSDDLYQWVHYKDIASGLRAAIECPTLPGHGVYTLSGPDTRCPEPTMELLERFRPDLAKRVTRPLPGRLPLMSIDLAKKSFGYNPTHYVWEN